MCKTYRTSIAGLLVLPPWKSLEETGRACRFLGRIILRVLKKLHLPQTAKKFFHRGIQVIHARLESWRLGLGGQAFVTLT